VVAGGALVVLVALAFSVGRFPVTPAELIAVLWSKLTGTPHGLPSSIDTVVFNVRGPRIAAAILVGAALAAAGAAYQGLFRNPLVSPDILGVSTGAALGAVVGIYLSLSVVAIQTLAFVVGLGAVVVVYAVGTALRRHDPVLVLVLAGIVIGTLLGSCVSLLKYLADPYNQLPAITFWLLGSLASVTLGDVRAVAPSVVREGRSAGTRGPALRVSLAGRPREATSAAVGPSGPTASSMRLRISARRSITSRPASVSTVPREAPLPGRGSVRSVPSAASARRRYPQAWR
jgi:hypothetical protein